MTRNAAAVMYQVTNCAWVCSWAFYSASMVSFSMPIVHCRNPHNSVINLNIFWANLPTSCFFGNVLAILGLLFFHINFRISLFNSLKNSVDILIGIVLNLWLNLGIFEIFNILGLPSYEMKIFLHLFTTPLMIFSNII